METLWNLQFHVVRSHAIVAARHQFGFPYLLAGIAHEDGSEALRSLRWLRRLDEAHQAALSKADPVIQGLVKGCPLQCTVPRFAVLFGRAGSWEEVTPQLLSLVRSIFFGPAHTKVVEDTMQKLRDHECRDGSSKSMARFQAWSSPIDAGVLQTYDFEEVAPATNCAVPKTWASCSSKFSPVHGSDSAKDSLALRDVLQHQSWPTYNSQTIWATYGILNLLMVLHEGNCWEKAADSWTLLYSPSGLAPGPETYLRRTTIPKFTLVELLV